MTVHFIGTHVGHTDEVRTKRPSKAKQSIVKSKDSRKIQNDLNDEGDVTSTFEDEREVVIP